MTTIQLSTDDLDRLYRGETLERVGGPTIKITLEQSEEPRGTEHGSCSKSQSCSCMSDD